MDIPSTSQTDPIRMALEAHGIETFDHHLFETPDSDYIGPRFRIRNCEMIYRLAESDLLMIVLYRRLEQFRSIKNPFADLLWFILLATEPRFGIRRIMGSIETFEYAHENGLSNRRLTRFYERFFAAQQTSYDGGIWLYRDIDDSVRAMLARAGHKATRVGAPGDARVHRRRELNESGELLSAFSTKEKNNGSEKAPQPGPRACRNQRRFGAKKPNSVRLPDLPRRRAGAVPKDEL